MTVADLIKKLKKFPQDHIVIVSSDEEGNGFRPLGAVQEEIYDAIEREVRHPDDFDDDERPKPSAVCLWP